MKSHKFADIFPMMNEDDFNNLKKDIKEKGFDKNRPIILYEGEILDGRNRYQACQELDIKPIFIDYNGNDPLYYVISNNLNRRHLNESQRSIAGMKYKVFESEEAKKRMSEGGRGGLKSTPLDSGKARDRAGEIVHVSGRLIDRAEYIQEKAPEIIQQIERGETTVGKAYGDLKRAEAETPEWLRYLDVWSFKENTGEGISNLPPEIIKRKKIGFTVPLDKWFRGPLYEYLQKELNDPIVYEFFGQECVTTLLERQKRYNCSLQLWAMLNFKIWHQIYFKPKSI